MSPENNPSSNNLDPGTKSPGSSTGIIKDFLKVFLFPMIINKFFMLYFGAQYSEHPGEGWGYGLAATILFLLFTIGAFLWKYRNVEDP